MFIWERLWEHWAPVTALGSVTRGHGISHHAPRARAQGAGFGGWIVTTAGLLAQIGRMVLEFRAWAEFCSNGLTSERLAPFSN
ncbi:MAG: hypothetical protein VX780_07520 [Pseudomonadota bacterium]|nr:hypothetical protein [Pseudomonadota bacterium]